MARYHFIGICGTAMATLAALMKARGHSVQGSDAGVYPPMSDFLAHEGITVFDGYLAERITPEIDKVVVGNAISRGNAELEAVLDRKVRFTSLPELLRDEFLWQSRSVVIAGTHGKTTTTSLAAWLFTACGNDPSALIGGIAANFDGSYRVGSGRDFIIEGDEYDSAFFDKTAKFLKYLPDIAVIGNLEYDHADIYASMDELRTAFRRFVGLVPRQGRLIVGADSEEGMRLVEHARCRVETFGIRADADWRASQIVQDGDRIRFDLTVRGEPRGPVVLPMFGEHNVLNALAAMAAGDAAGLGIEDMARALLQFKGVKRRLELRGVARGVSVFDDFAHHPTAIKETVRAVRRAYPDRRVWAVFEPRSATSCRRIFQDDFARAFEESGADHVVLASVFRQSLPEAERLSVHELVARLHATGKSARHVATVPEIVALIAAEAREGDLVVIMSNGGFGGIHDQLLTTLGGARA
jgi:UDP-N-acetylmuramate: L-alanyl-gamma-D-glutamyl-meso-diaminopimelate ligase